MPLCIAAGCVPISSNLRMSLSCDFAAGMSATCLDAVFAHIQHAGAHRRRQPLVQAGAVVVAIDFVNLNGTCAKACAPSTMLMMLCCRARAQISLMGNICPVMKQTCEHVNDLGLRRDVVAIELH